jgi:peptidoglycan hydrolase-like protein with peptidoglycan-binding domain
MRGAAVRALQQRLAQLHYYPGPANGHFGIDTLEAVWAFKEVQGLPTTAGPNDGTNSIPPFTPVFSPPGGERKRRVSK